MSKLLKHLNTCKFCNTHPEGEWGSDCYGFGTYYIFCENPECPEQPTTSDSNQQCAEDEWQLGTQYEDL